LLRTWVSKPPLSSASRCYQHRFLSIALRLKSNGSQKKRQNLRVTIRRLLSSLHFGVCDFQYGFRGAVCYRPLPILIPRLFGSSMSCLWGAMHACACSACIPRASALSGEPPISCGSHTYLSMLCQFAIYLHAPFWLLPSPG